jgi:hypothetical protein
LSPGWIDLPGEYVEELSRGCSHHYFRFSRQLLREWLTTD